MTGRRPEALLCVDDLAVVYGRSARAIDGLSFEVGRGEIVALLGPNGAGKTTTLNAIAGFLPGDRAAIARGTVSFEGRVVTNLPPHRVTRLGISMVAERDKIFPAISVADNLRLGALANPERGRVAPLYDLVHRLFPVLLERRGQMAGYLSGGERQMLSISTALLTGPKILLVDELSLGLAPRVVGELVEILRTLNRTQGLTIVLVEQSATVAFALADYVYVISGGRGMVEGSPDELRSKPDFRAHYLGVGEEQSDVSSTAGTRD